MAIQTARSLKLHADPVRSGIWTTVLLVSVVVAQFFALDFSSGFVRKPALSRRDRLDTTAGRSCSSSLSTAFSVFGIAVFEILLKAAGFAYAHAGFGPGNRRLVRCCCLSFGRMECSATATWLTRVGCGHCRHCSRHWCIGPRSRSGMASMQLCAAGSGRSGAAGVAGRHRPYPRLVRHGWWWRAWRWRWACARKDV